MYAHYYINTLQQLKKVRRKIVFYFVQRSYNQLSIYRKRSSRIHTNHTRIEQYTDK